MNVSALLDELLVVIVLYETRAGKSASYLSLLNACGTHQPYVLFYDNSPFSSSISGKNIIYLHDPTNGGVSKAYNEAARWGNTLRKKWLLLLDQDSILPLKFFTQVANTIRRNPASNVFVPRVYDCKGLLSPFVFHAGRGRRITSAPQVLSLQKYRFINSGLFISYSVFAEAGGYDEAIPLDFSDISFGTRLGIVTPEVPVIDCDLRHDFSDNRHMAVQDALIRYRHYCTGAFILAIRNGHKRSLYLQALARATRLTYQYHDIRFLKSYFQWLV